LDVVEEPVEEGDAVGLVMVAGVVALAEDDGNELDAGRRILSIPGQLVPELEAHLASYGQRGANGLVFTGDKGGPLRDHVWQAKWARARRAAGLPDLHFHDLRHVANTLTAASGASTRELMHRMGHASPAAALRYQHATRDRDAVIAAVLGELMTAEAAPPTPLRAAAEDRQ
jgi:integrase